MFSTDAQRAINYLAGCGEVFDALGDGLDLVQSADLAALAVTCSEVMARARGLLAQVTAAAADRGVVHESGSLTPAAWLRDQGAAVNETDARGIARALELTHAPTLAGLRTALLAGEVTVAEATRAAHAYERLRTSTDPAVHDDLAAAVTALAGNGAGCADLRRFETEMLARYGTLEEEETRRRHEETHRGMTAFHQAPDGMYEALLRCGAADKAVIGATLDALMAPTPDPQTGEIDTRNPRQRRLDALITACSLVASRDMTGPMGTTTRVSLHLGPESLVPPCPHRARNAFGPTLLDGPRCDCPRAGCATDGGGTTLRPNEVRELICGAAVTPLVIDPHGTPLAVGRTERLATRAQRQALEARDGGCSFPGCGARTAWTQAHHIRHWADGGPTDLDNLALLCTRHHRFVHSYGVTGHVAPDGSRVHWHVTRTTNGWRPARPPGEHALAV